MSEQKINEEEQPPSTKTVFSKKILVSEKTKNFINKFFPNISIKLWNDWKWQLRNKIKDFKRLKEILNLPQEENFEMNLPLAITPYYMSLLYDKDELYPLAKCVVPSWKELIHSDIESIDPLGEDHDMPVQCIVHRYPDRVLFLTTNICSVNCRYCTRSRVVGEEENNLTNKNKWIKAIEYIKSHTEIRDVLLSGGDPLTLSDGNIEWLLQNIRQISHVEIIRIGTKTPIVLPQRITKNLLKILKKYPPIFMSIHLTHPDEITEESSYALNELANAGVPLGSQTVLLADVNDNVETMKSLFQKLLKVRVKPYYLYQCDPIKGSSHFRTSVQKGLEIIQGLRGWTSGYAIPHYVIDAPNGGGKIPLIPNYVVERKSDEIVLKNYEGKIYSYPDLVTV
jgi:lysine 2,3-aminomutase